MTSLAFRAVAVLLVAALAGCAAVTKVESGETLVGNRLAVQVAEPWNQFERGFADNTPTWTPRASRRCPAVLRRREGRRTAGADADRAARAQPLTFRAAMRPAE